MEELPDAAAEQGSEQGLTMRYSQPRCPKGLAVVVEGELRPCVLGLGGATE